MENKPTLSFILVGIDDDWQQSMTTNISFEKNIESAHILKNKKYNDLKSDLEDSGWTPYLLPFEIGSRGLITKRNKSSIINTFKKTHIKVKHRPLFKELLKISLLCSFFIFQAHAEPSWEDPPYPLHKSIAKQLPPSRDGVA